MKYTMLLPLLILLTGCQMPRYTWYNPNSSPEQMQRDIGECKLQAMSLPADPTLAAPVATSYPVKSDPMNYAALNAGAAAVPNAVNQNFTAQAEQQRRQQYYRACMESKGYILNRTQ